jgi:hypothetical protein
MTSLNRLVGDGAAFRGIANAKRKIAVQGLTNREVVVVFATLRGEALTGCHAGAASRWIDSTEAEKSRFKGVDESLAGCRIRPPSTGRSEEQEDGGNGQRKPAGTKRKLNRFEVLTETKFDV